MNAAVDYEAEYNNRARVPEHPAHIAGWARDAAAWRETHSPHSITYGPGARNRIDFLPGDGNGAVVELWPASALSFLIERGADGLPESYRFLPSNALIPARDVIHKLDGTWPTI